jgi:hypothetical protein
VCDIQQEVIGDFCRLSDVHLIKHSLFKRHTMEEITRLVSSFAPDERVLFVAKSQGAWRLLNWLKKCDIGVNMSRFHAITIDPHHWFMGSMSIDCNRPNLIIQNFWQDTNDPKGAHVIGASNLWLGDFDHWNIIHSHTVSSAVKTAIRHWSIIHSRTVS